MDSDKNSKTEWEKKLEEVGAKSFKTFNESGSQANLFSTIGDKDNSMLLGAVLDI